MLNFSVWWWSSDPVLVYCKIRNVHVGISNMSMFTGTFIGCFKIKSNSENVCSDSNLTTGGRTSRTASSSQERTAWWWSGMREDSGTTCPATITWLSPAKREQVRTHGITHADTKDFTCKSQRNDITQPVKNVTSFEVSLLGLRDKFKQKVWQLAQY